MKRNLIILITLLYGILFADYEWITHDEWGTYNNQARHIVRFRNYVHAVYCDRMACQIIYLYSSDYGNSWATAETVFQGSMGWVPMWTAIGVDGQNRPWIAVACVRDEFPNWQYGELYLYIRRGINNWRIIPLMSLLFYEVGVPSMVISNTSSSEPMAYITIPFSSYYWPPEHKDTLFFFAVDTNRIWYKKVVDISSTPMTAAISYTPADYFHIVWEKGGRVYYQTILSSITPYLIRQGRQPQWSATVPVSFVSGYPTEPTSNPSVEAQGEWVYVVWRGPNEEGNRDFGEIWQRVGRIRPGDIPEWLYPPKNLSKSPLRESNYPQMSTGAVCVWQESLPNNNEVYVNIKFLFQKNKFSKKDERISSF